MKKTMKRLFSLILVLALAVTLAPSISSEAAAKKPKKITLKVSSKTVTVGSKVKVSVKSVKPAKASKAVTYKSSNKSIATVSSKGYVTGKKAGVVKITATSKKNKKVKASIKVYVVNPPMPSDPGETSDPVEPEKTADPYVEVAATADEVTAAINGTAANTVLIDARAQEAYAGWKLQGAANGGHLEGALLFSARWLECPYSYNPNYGGVPRETKLANYLKQLEMSNDNSYIVYDYTGEEAIKVAEFIYSQGYTNVKTFNAKDMIDAGEKVSSYNNHDYFIPTEIVKDISDYKTGKDTTLEASTLAVIGDKIDDVVLIDVSYGNVHESSYISAGHVPGAVHMNTNAYERPRIYESEKVEKYALEYSLIPIEEFRDELCPQYGITKDSIVIGISTDGRPIARFGYMLRTIGVKYYGMSGLMTAWDYNGYERETKVNKPVEKAAFGSTDIPNPNEIVWIEDLKEHMDEMDVWDTSYGTLIGKKGYDPTLTYSTYSYHDVMGDVQGSTYANLCSFENIDGTPTIKELLLKSYAENNIDMTKPVIHWCGDGWGASQEAYEAQQNDLTNVKYWGQGWVVWSNTGNWFIDYQGRVCKYDKYLDEVVDKDGNIIHDNKVLKDSESHADNK